MNSRPVVWSDEAIATLDGIVDYILAFNPAAGIRLGERIVAIAKSLDTFPERGRPSADGTRELTSANPYIIRYRVESDQIVIVRVRHAARDSA